jgi:ABC-type lipoprotein export system ATPase subunit
VVSGKGALVVGRGLTKRYGTGEAATSALGGVDIDLRAGELTAVVGPSGSGKSTLMHLLSGLDTPTAGLVEFDGRNLADLSDRQLAACRARDMGFVLQHHNLIPSLTIVENVAAPLLLSGRRRGDAMTRAREMLEAVGVSHRADARPSEVSGGEAQRAAVARACAGRPRLIFADEPTGALDSASGAVVLDLFLQMVKRDGFATGLLITHDPAIAGGVDRVVHIRDGVIEND